MKVFDLRKELPGFADYLDSTMKETDDVEAVQMFRTSDGTTFEAQAEAEAHERALTAEAEIDKFIATQEYKRGQGTHAKNVLMAFSAWKNGG